MTVCDKCRCREVCGYQEEYVKETESAKANYKPSLDIFETVIRCNKYIPEKSYGSEHKSNGR